MKRLNMLLVPLFAMPLLVGCKIGNLDDQHSLSFECENCWVIIDGKKEDNIAIFVNKNKKAVYTFEVVEGYTLSKDYITIRNTETSEDFTDFEYADNKLTFTITANLAVKAVAGTVG